jgi:hypothetical protein
MGVPNEQHELENRNDDPKQLSATWWQGSEHDPAEQLERTIPGRARS